MNNPNDTATQYLSYDEYSDTYNDLSRIYDYEPNPYDGTYSEV